MFPWWTFVALVVGDFANSTLANSTTIDELSTNPSEYKEYKFGSCDQELKALESQAFPRVRARRKP